MSNQRQQEEKNKKITVVINEKCEEHNA